MIRVEVTQLDQTVQEPMGPRPPETDYTEPVIHRRTLLLQEFDGLNLERLIAHLNELEAPVLCECGHEPTRHIGSTGKCGANDHSYLVGTSGCRCEQFRTVAAATAHQDRKYIEKLLGDTAALETQLEAAEAAKMEADDGNATATEKWRKADKALARRKQELESLRVIYRERVQETNEARTALRRQLKADRR